MKQITEDYVSYEIAKLLKEKGFDVPCDSYYEWFESNVTLYNGYVPEFSNSNINHNQFGYRTSRPSQSLALKWLREVHNIHISINIGCDVDNKNYVFYTPTIVKLSNKSVEYIEPFGEDDNEFDSSEQAVEAAILYVLKNLI